jgi:hypothetical protein
MAKIKGWADPYWHEKNLIILILNKGALRKKELFEKIREEQRNRIVFGEKGQTHSKDNYDKWLKSLEKQWIVSRYEDDFKLTPLGKWIAKSQLGTFFERANFAELMCHNCSKPADLTLLKPLPDTAETNVKGRLFMNVECPRCQYSMNRLPISNNLTKNQFINFYNHSVEELKRLLKIEALNV